MYGYVYIVECLINNKKYIGQHKGEFTTKYLGSGKIQKQSIKKYGKDNFSVSLLSKCYSKQELDESEKFWIDFYKADQSDDFYNIKTGGLTTGGLYGKNNGRYGKTVSKETRLKISKANKGLKRTKEQRERNRKSHIGLKIHTDEYKKKLSEKMKTDANPWKNNHNKKYIMTEEIKDKIRKTVINKYIKENHPMYGTHRSDETKKKISESRKGKYTRGNNPRAVKIYCIEDDILFNCIQDAAEYYSIDRNRVARNNCKGKTFVRR